MEYSFNLRIYRGVLQIGIIFFLFFFLSGIWAKPVAAAVARSSTINIVKQHFAKRLGLDLHNTSMKKKLEEVNLVEDLFLDRDRVSDALVRLYERYNIKNGDINLVNITEIAVYLEKHSSVLKKKKQGLTRGFEPVARGVTRDISPERGHTPKSPSKNSYVQTVFYATNRRQTGDSNPENFYSGQRSRDGLMNYGVAKVNIPLTHKVGQMELPWLSYLRSEKSHIYIRDLNVLDEKDFFHSLQPKRVLRGQENDLLVYIHGYNVTFEEGVRRAGQIAFDFGFAGTPIAFSWPSDGDTTAYNSDREDAVYSAKHLELFLEKLSHQNPGRKIHIIAHSMGSQALLHGLRMMALKNPQKRFASVILAAPDFDSSLFRQQIAQEIKGLANSWTIYASEKDNALWASLKYNSVKRLGTPLSVVNGYQIIDASEVQVTPWNLSENHSYYATKKVILDDMIKVLKGLLPKQRGLIASGQFWKIRLH